MVSLETKIGVEVGSVKCSLLSSVDENRKLNLIITRKSSRSW